LLTRLTSLYRDQNEQSLRFIYPRKFLFLCGGATPHVPINNKAFNLRDYLYRVKSLQRRLSADVVLAETATTLYRDSLYPDLITFEEDIARLASIVLVIPESAGSLAELGAFATNDAIRPALRAVVQARYANDNSFIRYGPLERMIKVRRDFVGFYTWDINNSQQVVIRSPDYREVLSFISRHIERIPRSTAFPTNFHGKLFCVLYWAIYVLNVAPEEFIIDCVRDMLPEASLTDIKNKLYCLHRISGWVDKISTDIDYYFATADEDPFDYSYNPGVAERDTVRRKFDIAGQMARTLDIPPTVFTRALAGRKAKR
jgi:hypothetical protein